MKKNNLTTALIAGIAGVAGIASVSTAVNLNSDGVGQVLIYPYYTVNNGIDTLLSVVNTTAEVKAVKVRFLEGKNSRECLDFNLYLSPFDVWTAALVATTSTEPGYLGQESVKILTNDTSCTAPFISGQEFLPFGYDPQGNGVAAEGYDSQGLDLKRCTEGHFEIIEMATIIGDDAVAATHVGGVPADCNALLSNWVPGSGKWLTDSSINATAPDGTGGLFGSTTLVSVDDGVAMTYNADAIQAYSTNLQHTSPGDTIPSIITGSSTQSIVFYNGVAVTTDWLSSPAQAISALYMHDNVYGEYSLSDAIGADTEWVLTFPTKFAYVDPVSAIGTGAPFQPFTQMLNVDGSGACEPYAVSGVYNREEQTTPLGEVIPSPRRPGQQGASLCWETNILEFHTATDVFGTSRIFGSQHNTAFVPGFDEGWTSLSFATQSTDNNVAGTVYSGLPITGFAAVKFVNGALPNGTLANYAGLFTHRFSRNIQ